MIKLKAQPKYEDYKKRKSAVLRKCREKKKADEKNMSVTLRKRLEDERRDAVRERVRLCRERKRLAQGEMFSQNSESNGYESKQSLGKAVSKVTRALPQSPRKRETEIRKIVALNKISGASVQNSTMSKNDSALDKAIREFYEKDDISRVSPKMRDVKQFRNENGEKILLPTRHMLLTLKECFARFRDEQNSSGKGTEKNVGVYSLYLRVSLHFNF